MVAIAKKPLFLTICCSVLLKLPLHVFSQFAPCDCTATAASGTVNFSTLTWTGTGCPTSGTTTTSKNLCLNLVNGTILTMDKNFTVSGTSDFKITNSGNSTFSLPSGFTLNVGGDFGDNTNNNVSWVINGTLDVDGTMYGKNSNGFSGTGSLTAGGLNFNQTPSPTGSGITWNVPPGNCQPTGTWCTTVTPVTLSSFQLERDGNTIQLNWSTASELNFDYFDIQRASSDFIFTSIGKVEGNGTTNVRHDYGFIDELPRVGKNYYRLRSIDFDGYTETFQIIAIDFEGEKQFYLSPNPSDGASISAKVNFTPRENAVVIVYDNVGSIIGKFELLGAESSFRFSEQLKPGVYFARFSSDDFTRVSRFLVKE